MNKMTMMTLSLLNLCTARFKARDLGKKLIHRINIFKLYRFNEFCNSDKYDRLINTFKSILIFLIF